jgi:hypothetical protein
VASPMQLREAVEIVVEGKAYRSDYDSEREFLEASKVYARARSIMDAAVEAHEAREGVRVAFESRPMVGGLEAVRDHMREAYATLSRAEIKLRALERGEEVK